MTFEGVPPDEDSGAGWLHPDDRLWRHPSEVAAAQRTQAPVPPREPPPRLWLVALLAGMIGSLLTTGLVAAAGGFNRGAMPVRSVERVAAPARSASVGSAMPVVDIADRVRPAIAKIDVSTDSGDGSGSGVVFREDGHVLTNHHVIRGARSITVEMSDGKTFSAKVVGGDPTTDVAVVKIDGEHSSAVLGSATELKVGQQAIAIGSPLGLAGGPSLSVGVVSALGREVGNRDGGTLYDMIQTDAPIAPGSSGGALLDGTGAVIGITTAIAVDPTVGAEGLGFATPIDIARDVAEQIIATGRVRHVWLGINGSDADDETAREFGADGGVLIRKVVEGSPADEAGLGDRDLIVAVEGRPVRTMGALIVALRGHRPGDTVEVTYVRGKDRRTAEAKLAERPRGT